MDYFANEYKERCKKEFSIYGFKFYRNNSYRIVNDVFQSFNLHRSILGQTCTIEFAIIPLCIDYKIDKTTCNAYHIKMFEGSYAWFEYDKKSHLSVEKCINELINYIKKYLIPFFEKGNNCKMAYRLICDFEEKNCVDGMLVGSSIKYCMAIKNGDYRSALLHLNAMFSDTEKIYNNICNDHAIEYEYKLKILKKLQYLKTIINMINDKNIALINEFINENENKSLANLGVK